MDEWKTRLRDETKAPPGFADGVMGAIHRRNAGQGEKKPIYTPMAKGILCIAAAVLLLVLSMPKLDAAWSAISKIGPGMRVTRGTEVTPAGDDGLTLPAGGVLYVLNR